MRIARSEHNRVGAGERRRDEYRRLVDDPAHEVRDERDVKTRRIPDRRTLRHAEPEQIYCVDGVGSRESVDIVTPLVGPRRGVNSMDQEHRWTFATLGESDASVPPIEAALLSAD